MHDEIRRGRYRLKRKSKKPKRADKPANPKKGPFLSKRDECGEEMIRGGGGGGTAKKIRDDTWSQA